MKTDPYSTNAIAKHLTESIDVNSSRAKRAVKRKATPKKRIGIRAKRVTRRMAMALGYMGRVWTPDTVELMKVYKEAKGAGLDAKEVIRDVTKKKILGVVSKLKNMHEKFGKQFIDKQLGKPVIDVYEKIGKMDRALKIIEGEISH